MGRTPTGPPRLIRIRVLSALRRLGSHRNEMRRPVDRMQSAIACGLIFTFVMLGPVAAAWAVHRVYDSGVQAEHWQAATRHLVDATVVRRLDSVGAISGEAVRERARVAARWTGRG